MAQADQLNLLPPLVESGHTQDFFESGQVISAVFSHAGNSLAVFVSNAQTPSADHKSHFEQEQPVYFVAHRPNVAWFVFLLFISDTLLIFEAFRNLVKSHPKRPPGGDVVAIMRKLAIDYVNFIKECWIHASQPIPRPEPLQYSSDHYRTLYSCFSLFVVLFLPEPGYDDAPIGEELVGWLNIHFIEPSTEERDQLSALDAPWEDENFWPYLTRATLRGLTKAAVFFLMLQHPSEELQELTQTPIPLVEGQPRLQNFTTERELSHAFRRWQEKVKALRISMSRVPEDDRFDDFDNWWDRLSDIVGVLEGREEVLLRVCTELGADWKEACAAWGVLIDSRLRRVRVATNTYTLLLRALATAARASPKITVALLEADIVDTLYQILMGVLPSSLGASLEQGDANGGQGLGGGLADMTVMENLAHRPKDQIEEALSLVSELMPPLPKDGVFDYKAYTEKALAKMVKAKAKAECAAARQAAHATLAAAMLIAPLEEPAPAADASSADTQEDPTPGASVATDRTQLLRSKAVVVDRFMQLTKTLLHQKSSSRSFIVQREAAVSISVK
ncbi:hypothetical protein C8J56DRAFT_1079610 [Mycena floridula]|nr:hypothetical protein C8J56DRAFT_1079610 [Mycena floridula]